MKRMRVLIVPLAVILVLGMSSLAYASGYVSPPPPYPIHPDDPHHGYATTTNKCKVCHAVHLATGTFKLTRAASAETACDYCHVGAGAQTAKKVYTNALPKAGHYLGVGLGTTPDTSKSLTGNLYCYTCHSVHGANTIAGTDILKKDPAGDTGVAADADAFCADCHDKNLNKLGTEPYASTTHKMVGADSVHAWVASSNCDSCHAEPKVPTGDYPHTSLSSAFLGLGASGTSVDATKLDNNCLKCHQNPWPTPTQGVGKTF